MENGGDRTDETSMDDPVMGAVGGAGAGGSGSLFPAERVLYAAGACPAGAGAQRSHADGMGRVGRIRRNAARTGTGAAAGKERRL